MAEVIFLTAGKIEFASSRYRGFWPAKYMSSAEVYPLDYALTSGSTFASDTKAVVFQKFYYAPLMKFAHNQGLKVIWDVCDPGWWFQRFDCLEILQYIDLITASTQALLDDLRDCFPEYSPIDGVVIPDAFDFEHYEDTPVNIGYQADDEINLIWYGHQNNRITIMPHLAELTRFTELYDIPVNLTILDGNPKNRWQDKYINVKNVKWTLDTEVEVIASHNLAFLPTYPGRWGRLKSNNKRVHAGLCGLHVYNPEKPKAPLLKMLTWGEEELDEGRLKKYDASIIAKQWEEVIQ